MTAKPVTPAAQGWSFPAEWETHAATWLSWPQAANKDWIGKNNAVQWVYTEMIRRLAAVERVRLLVNDATVERRAKSMLKTAWVPLDNIDFIRCPTDRGWTRDFGPMFVRRAQRGVAELAILDFHFNGWGNRCRANAQDRQVARKMAKRYNLPLLEATSAERPDDPRLILEGGAIDVNGRGTLMTTEECLLDQRVQVRNPGMDRGAVERVLCDWFGVSNILWLNKGIAADDTHGHVDDCCRFVNAKTVVLNIEPDRSQSNHGAMEENRERLEQARLEDGSKVEIVRLPMPEPLRCGSRRLPASYANFLIANGLVLVPTFNDPKDRIALGILAELFPGRSVIGIHAVDLVLGMGAIHCLTQQEPAPGVTQ